MKKSADIVIIGAGVIGCSTAYHLAQMGITDVVVLEMDQPGSGSSSKSASMLTLQFCHEELTLRMAKYSYHRYMQFEEEIGDPIDFNRTGWVSLATPETSEQLLEIAHLLQSHDVTTEILEPAEIKRRYPEINTEDIVLGTWGPDDGPFDPHMILWGYLKKASGMGVKLYQGVRATGIRVERGRVVGVETDAGFVATEVVVNAAGPWATEVGGWAGVEIPLLNLARCIWVTTPFPDIPSDRPFVDDLTAAWYYRPEGPCILMGMGAIPTEDFELNVSNQLMDEMIDVAIHRVPILEKASILTSWTGIRSLTPDGHPILGPVSSVDGLVLSCGWGGTGIIQAPIAGQLVAEYIHDGSTITMSIDALRVDRFKAI
jgi:sarcosine oxidase subunit beta